MSSSIHWPDTPDPSWQTSRFSEGHIIPGRVMCIWIHCVAISDMCTRSLEKISSTLSPSSTKKEHSKRRKTVASSFSLANVKAFEPNVLVYVQRFLDAFLPQTGTNSSWGPAINVADWCSYLTFDVMTDFVFGLKYDLLRCQTWQHVVHDIEATNVWLYVLMHSKFLHLGRFDRWLFPAAVRGSRGFLRFIDQVRQGHRLHGLRNTLFSVAHSV
ncbi:uncharacterized protein DSM5745_05178 [Aspergillus mulundensis]|uniref:Uncharacterized protein n=1 Tax=Aspergillus mulundensis TaxID=1810919 RepID=A0A3D8S6C8_9EURO|nr:hypothetical protein DSM5745_05178 [Aspergillus mulundensis]RDW81621.1 hypothetical protein DSM5745_05178 [Aspergillus mulundensis]